MKNIINKVITWAKTVSIINWIKVGLLAVVLIAGGIYFSQKKDVKVDTTDKTPVATTTKSTATTKTTSTVKTQPAVLKNVTNKCNFRVTSPTMYSSVSMPFTVTGIIDKADTSKGCIWSENLSRAGDAEIFYNRNGEGWKSAGSAVPIITSGIPGAATTTLAFSIQFNLYTTALGLKSGTPIKITFKELNVLEYPNPDIFDFLVSLK